VGRLDAGDGTSCPRLSWRREGSAMSVHRCEGARRSRRVSRSPCVPLLPRQSSSRHTVSDESRSELRQESVRRLWHTSSRPNCVKVAAAVALSVCSLASAAGSRSDRSNLRPSVRTESRSSPLGIRSRLRPSRRIRWAAPRDCSLRVHPLVQPDQRGEVRRDRGQLGDSRMLE